MENAIQVKNLTKEYKDFKLEDISFELPSGMVLGLIGENGAGKSTLINSILGITEAEYEQISILGKDLQTQPKQAKEDIAAIFNDSHYDLSFTPLSVGKMLARIYKNWD